MKTLETYANTLKEHNAIATDTPLYTIDSSQRLTLQSAIECSMLMKSRNCQLQVRVPRIASSRRATTYSSRPDPASPRRGQGPRSVWTVSAGHRVHLRQLQRWRKTGLAELASSNRKSRKSSEQGVREC